MPNILGKYDPLRGCPKCGYNPRKEGEVEGAAGVDDPPGGRRRTRLEKEQAGEGGPAFYPATEQLLGQAVALKALMSVEDWTFASFYWEEFDFGLFIRNKIRAYCYREAQGTKDIDWQQVEKAAHEYVGARYRI